MPFQENTRKTQRDVLAFLNIIHSNFFKGIYSLGFKKNFKQVTKTHSQQLFQNFYFPEK
jgi:hypothetical protein